MSASESLRYCPLCDSDRVEQVCPEHGIPTVSGQVFTDETVDVMLGKVFAARYELDRVLGSGGMGKVYLAMDRTIGRKVALKTLHDDRAGDRQNIRRFYAEARAASLLSSPHVVRIFDFGFDEVRRVPFIAMEYLQGRTLKEMIAAEGPLGASAGAHIASHIARALTEAHQAGIVHRDLKPANVLVMDDPAGGQPFVKVMDFGIAKILGDDTSLTETGAALGTMAYMAPEQFRGDPVDARTDLYGLGCMLHTILRGSPPFAPQQRLVLFHMHMHADPPRLPDVDANGEPMPAALQRLVDGLLLKSRQGRPESPRLVAHVLDLVAERKAEQAMEALVAQKVQVPTPIQRDPRRPQIDIANVPTGTYETVLPGRESAIAEGFSSGVTRPQAYPARRRSWHLVGWALLSVLAVAALAVWGLDRSDHTSGTRLSRDATTVLSLPTDVAQSATRDAGSTGTVDALAVTDSSATAMAASDLEARAPQRVPDAATSDAATVDRTAPGRDVSSNPGTEALDASMADRAAPGMDVSGHPDTGTDDAGGVKKPGDGVIGSRRVRRGRRKKRTSHMRQPSTSKASETSKKPQESAPRKTKITITPW